MLIVEVGNGQNMMYVEVPISAYLGLDAHHRQ